MITLTAPSTGEDRYILYQGFAIGPLDLLGKQQGEVITLPTGLGHFSQATGIWHENFVAHDKSGGTLMYHPIARDAIQITRTQYPFYVPNSFSIPAYSTGKNIQVIIYSGFAVSQATTLRRISVYGDWEQYAIEKTGPSPTDWTVYRLYGRGLTPDSSYGAQSYQMLNVSSYGKDTIAHYENFSRYNRDKIPKNIDWFQLQSFDVIKSAVLSGSRSSLTFRQVQATWVKALPSQPILSPTAVSSYLDSFVLDRICTFNSKYNVNYGDLAMQASEKVNAININMIAFLRDFRHPTEMIPKLANLRKLKSYSNDYLTVKYGILPTISDIQKIIGSCKKIAPYLDRNGFSTYNASSSKSAQIDNVHFETTQRIKLAIGNEDFGLASLIQRLESFGVLPTFENLWDLVPYSFVIDWLLDVGSLLQRVDTRLRLLRLPIYYTTMSQKSRNTVNLTASQQYPYTGQVYWEQYQRWVSDQCPVPPLSLQPTSQGFSHWLEAGALLIQRTK